MARVLVAMSGGVDSSVAAALLAEAGHEVTGVTLKLWGGDGDSGCCSLDDVEDARRVAAQLGIAHYVFNLTDDFEKHVVGPYVDAYSSGRTPNPCVECNRTIKWGRLLDRSREMGFERLATGHHARVVPTFDGPVLERGRDPLKDQSYVLYMLGAAELAHTMLPIGELTKGEVRRHASRLALRTADKPDSQDVCFIARSGRAAFIEGRAGVVPGPIVDATGTTLGTHRGIHEFTIGQRRRLGVATGERRFVVDVDAASATVTIGRREDLLRDEVRLLHLRFAQAPPAHGQIVLAQMSAHGDVVEACVTGNLLRLAEKRPRVAPGQVVALYEGDRLLGGGVAA